MTTQKVVAFTAGVEIRDFSPEYLEQLIALYQDVFAGDIELGNGEVFSWGEYMKCSNCGVKYTRQEVSGLEASDKLVPPCKKCGLNISPVGDLMAERDGDAYFIENLVPYWSEKDVETVITGVREKSKGRVRVAWLDDEIVGFAMYFVNPYAPDIGYFADIGIDQRRRKKGVATALLQTLDGWAEENNLSSVYLRTDARNLAAVSLFEANGFEKIGFTEQDGSVQDNEYRIYLRKERAAPEGKGECR